MLQLFTRTHHVLLTRNSTSSRIGHLRNSYQAQFAVVFRNNVRKGKLLRIVINSSLCNVWCLIIIYNHGLCTVFNIDSWMFKEYLQIIIILFCLARSSINCNNEAPIDLILQLLGTGKKFNIIQNQRLQELLSSRILSHLQDKCQEG